MCFHKYENIQFHVIDKIIIRLISNDISTEFGKEEK